VVLGLVWFGLVLVFSLLHCLKSSGSMSDVEQQACQPEAEREMHTTLLVPSGGKMSQQLETPNKKLPLCKATCGSW
jgi:hypothetical protein